MGKTYSVHITRSAYAQMTEIRQFIEETLFAPSAAKSILVAFREAIDNLQYMPARHQLIEEEPWRKEGFRRIIVKNFYIYYWIDEPNERVNVTAVIYGRRDQVSHLSQMEKL